MGWAVEVAAAVVVELGVVVNIAVSVPEGWGVKTGIGDEVVCGGATAASVPSSGVSGVSRRVEGGGSIAAGEFPDVRGGPWGAIWETSLCTNGRLVSLSGLKGIAGREGLIRSSRKYAA